MRSVNISLIMMGLVCMAMVATLTSAATPAADDNLSGYPTCWAEINKCNGTKSADDTVDASTPIIPSCCSTLKTQMSDVKCFCSLASYVENNSNTAKKLPKGTISQGIALNVDTMLAGCNITGSFEDICKGLMIKGGSGKIAAMGIVPVAALIFATALFM